MSSPLRRLLLMLLRASRACCSWLLFIPGEICSSGFRNPWRCGFDDGDVLYCGDVGHTMVEEIDIVE